MFDFQTSPAPAAGSNRAMASAIEAAVDLKALHPEAVFLRILGVNYVHFKTDDEGDLYLTEYGIPFMRHLMPENWYEKTWFAAKKQRLQGTSTVYKIPTKPIEDHSVPSLDIVIKWSRVGMEVDLNTFTLQRNTNAEFNTPFEEFALLEELRRGEYGPSDVRVLTQKPLAIYVPPERFQPWQTGRSREKVLQHNVAHPGVAIDVLRAYILIYAWIDGFNAVEALQNSYFSMEEQQKQLEDLTLHVDREIGAKGFIVADHKPSHVIVRMQDGVILKDKDGRTPYAIIDYELLARTPEHEDFVRSQRRSEYLQRMKDRFLPRPPETYPQAIRPANVLGVEYVCGRCESTNGMLWVVGNDPELFPYFLPERWRGTPVRLSDTGQTFYTQTKDRIHLVWKVSRVGELPLGDLADPHVRRLLLQGYNNPFEEFALAFRLAARGVRTVFPRAIYMTASPGEVAAKVLDDRAFRRLHHARSPSGAAALPMDHDYVTIWGYWRGLDDNLAATDPQLWTPIDAASASAQGLIRPEQLLHVISQHSASLHAAGFEDSNFKPDHILLSHIPGGLMKSTPDGELELRQCNFEWVRPLEPEGRR